HSIQAYCTHRALHSFPTRRSSDLELSRRGPEVPTPPVPRRRGRRRTGQRELWTQSGRVRRVHRPLDIGEVRIGPPHIDAQSRGADRKSTRLNSSHEWISYAVFCLK